MRARGASMTGTEGRTVRYNVPVPGPVLLLARSARVLCPTVVGMPVNFPTVVSKVKPLGMGDSPKLEGALVPVIW